MIEVSLCEVLALLVAGVILGAGGMASWVSRELDKTGERRNEKAPDQD